MPTWIDHDADGFVYAAQTTEGPDVPSTRPLVADPDDAHQAAEGRLVRYVDGRFEVPRDDRAAWRLLRERGVIGEEHAAALDHVRELRGRWASDLAPEVLLPIPPPPSEAMLPGLDADFPTVPGLHFRAMTAMDLDLAATLAIETGIYPALCPDGKCSPPEAHAWMMLAHRIDRPDTWQTVLEFEGEPMQMELILHEGEQATISLTMHLTRERPHTFWREAEAPVIRALRRAGIRRLRSFARKDRPDWIQSLKDNYGAVEVAQLERTVHLEYPLDAMEARFTGFPAQKLLGFTQTAGALTVREAAASELPALDALLAAHWGADPRNALTRRMLREWVRLDRGTVIVGEVAGIIRHARVVRPRRGTVCAIGVLNRYAPGTPAQAAFSLALLAWCRAAGYTKATGFVPANQWDVVRVMPHMAGWVEIAIRDQFRIPLVEIGIDL